MVVEENDCGLFCCLLFQSSTLSSNLDKYLIFQVLTKYIQVRIFYGRVTRLEFQLRTQPSWDRDRGLVGFVNAAMFDIIAHLFNALFFNLNYNYNLAFFLNTR